jgi:mono/diheme cytochrome c family protein
VIPRTTIAVDPQNTDVKETGSMRRVSRRTRALAALAGLLLAAAVVSAQSAPPGPSAVPPEARKLKSPTPSSAATIQAGAQLYQKYCRFCHGDAGQGDGRMAPKNVKPSNLTDDEWTRGSSDGEIFWVIQNGAPPKYEMKGLKAKLSDQDIWNLVHYVRSLGGAPKSQ